MTYYKKLKKLHVLVGRLSWILEEEKIVIFATFISSLEML